MEKIISSEEMVIYMNKIFNSQAIKNAYIASGKTSTANVIFAKLGNILTKYYISTGDSSMESAVAIITDFVGSEKTADEFFKTLVLPRMENKIAEQMGMSGERTISDRIKIQKHIYKQNLQNPFYTHCFPGAIYEDVVANGLDISKELFKEELELWGKINKTPYKTGELNYCELSEGSLSYATSGIPERVKFALGIAMEQPVGEKTKDFFVKCMESSLENAISSGTINSEEREALYHAGMKIIEFYSVRSAGIAVFRKESLLTSNDLSEKRWKSALSEFSSREYGEYIEQIKKDALQRLGEAANNFDEIYEYFLNEIKRLFPELHGVIADFENRAMADITSMSIRNLLHEGFADGYAIEGGKMLPGEFVASKVVLPREVIMEYYATNELETQEGFSYAGKSVESKVKTKPLFVDEKKRTKIFSKALSQIAKEGSLPTRIENYEVNFSDEGKNSKRNIVLVVLDGKIKVVEYPLIEKVEHGAIFSCYSGDLDKRMIDNISMAIEALDDEGKRRVIEEYKLNNPDEIDENPESLEIDAFDWKARQFYSNMTPEAKAEKRRIFLENYPKFIVTVDNGIKVAQYKDGVVLGDAKREVLVESGTDAPYNSLFSDMTGVDLSKINGGYHKENIDTDRKKAEWEIN